MILVYFLIFIFLIILIILCINQSEIIPDFVEGFGTKRDFQRSLSKIDDLDDFKDFFEVYTGTRLIERINITNIAKINLVEKYLNGIEEMKQYALLDRIPLNRTPKYGKMIKHNGKDNFENYQNFL